MNNEMQIDITLEQALQRATAPLRRKMQHSVELLRKAERLAMHYDPQDGYFLAFSGGKDSQALYHMAQLAGVRFQAHMNLTSVDPPEVIRFVRRQYPDVQLTKPKDSIYNIAVQRQILPTMRTRWCCAEYKETAGAGRVTLIGIRHQESSRRAKRNEVEISSRKFSGDLDGLDEYRAELKAKREKKRSQQQDGVNITNATDEQTVGCIHGKESLLISPIIYWTERDVWEFLNDVVRVAHCVLYDQGWHRIGCINCPMASAKQKQIENERWPHVRRKWIKAIMRIRAGGGISEQTYLRNGGRNSYQKDIWRAESPAVAVFGGGRNGNIYISEWLGRDPHQSQRPPRLPNTKAVDAGRAELESCPTESVERYYGSSNPQYYITSMQMRHFPIPPTARVGNASPKNGVVGVSILRNNPFATPANQHRPVAGFSAGSSSVVLTEEQEREIAENIYDWWISGKGYKKWYAEKFLQQKLDFEE